MSSITVHLDGKESIYDFAAGVNLLEFLRSKGYGISAPCGGIGKCGNCKVRYRSSGKESIVTACQMPLNEDCEVFLQDESSDVSWKKAVEQLKPEPGRSGYGIAADLGTTTVSLALYDLENGRLLGNSSRFNAQQSFGADVISRISGCMERQEGLSHLTKLIQDQIFDMTEELCRKNEIHMEEVLEGFLAGNTIMEHIIAGISPLSIASAPYLPQCYFDAGESVMIGGIPFYLSPCIAGYVGGDITAGLLTDAVDWKEKNILFIDVGTNGEIALGNDQSFGACAVASGPAFEGAGITCGMPAVSGAVSKVERSKDGLMFEVIGGQAARGICGSGLLDLIACLLELGYIDEAGNLEDPEGNDTFYLTDTVYLTQQDIRQFQLAKAAVYAGVIRMMQVQKLDFDDIKTLYLSGGFGTRLRPESAVRTGMLPAEFLGRIQALGNTALLGAATALLCPSRRQELIELKNRCAYLELSTDQAFYDSYADAMNFPEE